MWHTINNRGHHSRSCHYLSGKLSSCTSAVVSGNKLMWCRNYTAIAVTDTVSAAANSNVCAGSVMCLHRVHRSSRMISSCVIIFCSCYLSCILFHQTLHSFIFTIISHVLIQMTRRRSTLSLTPRFGQRRVVFFKHPHQSMSLSDLL